MAAPHPTPYGYPPSPQPRPPCSPTHPTPVAGMSYHRDPAADPFLRSAAGAGGSDSDSDDDSEADAFRLRDDDLLVLAARNEDDVSHLEVGGWRLGCRSARCRCVLWWCTCGCLVAGLHARLVSRQPSPPPSPAPATHPLLLPLPTPLPPTSCPALPGCAPPAPAGVGV